MSIFCPADTLFGLAPSDLSDFQIKKITTEKLIEFLDLDSRIEDILVERITNDVESKEIRCYKYLNVQNWDAHQKLKDAYNTILDGGRFNNTQYYYRRDRVFWAAMNDANKLKELLVYSDNDNRDCVVSGDSIDFDWLCKTDYELATKIGNKILGDRYYGGGSSLSNLVSTANETLLLSILPAIQKMSGRYSKLVLLRSRHTPENLMNDLLRLAVKKNNWNFPEIQKPITNKALTTLPPIMRLDLLEKIVYKHEGQQLKNILADIHCDEDFRQLLFGALTKHPTRVGNLITEFNSKVNKEI